MRKNYIGLFDVIGPIMVGPSSSHTSGAATIAWMMRQIFSGTPVRADITFYGSFANTYRGHGTDRAVVGGLLGFKSYDERIRDAFELAKEAGLAVSFTADSDTETAHPNTIDILLEGDDGHTLFVRGESLGGGRVRIVKLNNISVEFTGEYSTLIVDHQDKTGTVAYITSRLAKHRINIAFMKLFREEKGQKAYTVIESDDYIPAELKGELLEYPTIEHVELIEL